MKINKSIFYLLLVFFVNFNALSKENVHIVYEIGGEIITNVDIKNEKNYLFIINPQLKSLNEAQLKQLLSGDKNAIIGVIMQNKQLRSLVMKEMMNNSELRGLIFELAKGSMRGGLTEAEKKAMTENAFAPYTRNSGFVNSLTENNTNRPIKDIARETEQRLKSADHYKNLTSAAINASENKVVTHDNLGSKVPFS